MGGERKGGMYICPVLPPLGQLARKQVPACLDCAKDLVPGHEPDYLRLVFAAGCGFLRRPAFGPGSGWRVGAGVGGRCDVMEGVGYQALGEAAVGEGEGGHHDLARCVVEVGVGYKWAEAQDFAGAVFCGAETGALRRRAELVNILRGSRRQAYVNVGERGELH